MLKFADEKGSATEGEVTYLHNNKELLDARNEQEIIKTKARAHSGTILSIMEDFYNIILFGEYSEADVQTMFAADNLLEDLAVLWQSDERVLELQETLLEEFLQQKKL